MATADELRALAERVMALTRRNWEVDAEIYAALNPTHRRILSANRFYDPAQISEMAAAKFITRGTFVVPAFTASLDAAMTLVPDLAVTSLAKQERWRSPAWTWGLNDKRAVTHFATAATPALALTAAALLARAAQMEN